MSCLTQWISKLHRSFEIHWVRQYLVNFMGLAGIVNATVYKTEPIFTGLRHGKLSQFSPLQCGTFIKHSIFSKIHTIGTPQLAHQERYGVSLVSINSDAWVTKIKIRWSCFVKEISIMVTWHLYIEMTSQKIISIWRLGVRSMYLGHRYMITPNRCGQKNLIFFIAPMHNASSW